MTIFFLKLQRELRERMLSKIMFLRDERDLLTEEKNENDQVGKMIAEKLELSASGTELDKFRQFLEEIEQITKLTVSLTIRLSRLTKRIETGTFSKEEMVLFIRLEFINYICTFTLKCLIIFSDNAKEETVSPYGPITRS